MSVIITHFKVFALVAGVATHFPCSDLKDGECWCSMLFIRIDWLSLKLLLLASTKPHQLLLMQ